MSIEVSLQLHTQREINDKLYDIILAVYVICCPFECFALPDNDDHFEWNMFATDTFIGFTNKWHQMH